MGHHKTASPAKPVVLGTGLVALDVVIADDATTDPILCAGGTCGNVLIALAFLGWDAYPIARLRSDSASKRVVERPETLGSKVGFCLTQRIRQHSSRGAAYSGAWEWGTLP